MMSDGEVAYNGYVERLGTDMPAWTDLIEQCRAGWEAAARAVLDANPRNITPSSNDLF